MENKDECLFIIDGENFMKPLEESFSHVTKQLERTEVVKILLKTIEKKISP